MKLIKLLLICTLFLVGCSSQSNNFLGRGMNESIGFSEPTSPPRNKDEITYYDFWSEEAEPGSFTEKYKSEVTDFLRKFEEDTGEYFSMEDYQEAHYKAQELFMDKKLYTNIH